MRPGSGITDGGLWCEQEFEEKERLEGGVILTNGPILRRLKQLEQKQVNNICAEEKVSELSSHFLKG